VAVALEAAIQLILRVSSRQLALSLTRWVVSFFLFGATISAGAWTRALYSAVTNKNSFLGTALRFTPVPVIAKGLDWAVHKFHHNVSHHAAANVAPMAHYFDGLATRSRAMNMAHVAVAESTAQGFYDMRHKVMVPYVRARVRPVMRHAVRGEALGERSISLGRRETNERRRSISHINTKLGALALGFLGIDYLVKRHHAKAHQHAHLHTIPKTAAQAGRTARQVRAHARRISRLERLLRAGALAAAITAVLVRTIPSWRCSNFRNIRRLLRCSHWRWLEAMLFLAVDALALRDLCQLVGYIERGAVAFQPTVHALIVTGENFVCGDLAHLPSGVAAADRADSPGFASGIVGADFAY
jgi:hypothetical protein